MTAAHTAAAASRHCVNLVDKYNTGAVLLGVREQITDTGSTYTDEHLYEIRTGDTEERHACLACDGLGKQGLTGSGRTLQQHAFQEIYDLTKLFFFFLQTCHIFKGGVNLLLGGHTGPASAEVHHLAATAAVGLTVHQDHHNDYGHYSRQKGRAQGRHPVIGAHCSKGYRHILRLQKLSGLCGVCHIHILTAAVLQGQAHRAGRCSFGLADHGRYYLAVLHGSLKLLIGIQIFHVHPFYVGTEQIDQHQ